MDLKGKNKKYLLLLLAAAIIWTATIPCIGFLFGQVTNMVIVIKLIQLPVLYGVFKGLERLHSNIKRGIVSPRVLPYFFGYFLLLFLFFLLIYPGSWRWDDTIIFNVVASGDFNYWHHYLTSVFFMLCLMFFPSPAAVMIGQMLVISALVAYMVYRISNHLKNPYLRLCLFIPFILIPTISTNLWPMRLVIYSYMELLMVVELVLTKIEKRPWKFNNLAVLVVMSGLLSVWRTEGFYYAVMIPVVFCLLFKNETSKKTKIWVVLSMLFCSLLFYIPQRVGEKDSGNMDYQITGLCVPLVPLTHQAVVNKDNELLEGINKVFDADVLERAYQDGVNGEYIFWNKKQYPFVRAGLSSESFEEFKTIYIKMIVKYPGTYLKNRLQYLKRTAVGSWDPSTTTLYDEPMDYVKEFSSSYYFNQPLSLKVRNSVGEFLECSGPWIKLQFLENFMPQLAVLLLINLWLLFKHKNYLLLSLTYDLRIVLTFLTAPTGWFLYYFSAYLGGLMVVVVWLVWNADRKL